MLTSLFIKLCFVRSFPSLLVIILLLFIYFGDGCFNFYSKICSTSLPIRILFFFSCFLNLQASLQHHSLSIFRFHSQPIVHLYLQYLMAEQSPFHFWEDSSMLHELNIAEFKQMHLNNLQSKN